MRFNDKAAEAALKQRLIVALKQLQSEFLNEIRAGMKTPEGANSMYEGEIGETAGILWAEVVGGAWAVIDNWGTGSLLDRDNPWLDEYMASPYWNKTRGKHGVDDTAIRSRPGGTTNIFGEVKDGNSPGGFNLEAAGWVQPQPPSRAIETAKRWMENGRVQKVLLDALADVNLGSFFEGDGR